MAMAHITEEGATIVEYPIMVLFVGLFVSVAIDLFSHSVSASYFGARAQLSAAGGTVTTNGDGMSTR